jgi:hypothetical protein
MVGVALLLLSSWRLGRIMTRASVGLLLPDAMAIFILICGTVDFSFLMPLNVASLLFVIPLLRCWPKRLSRQ